MVWSGLLSKINFELDESFLFLIYEIWDFTKSIRSKSWLIPFVFTSTKEAWAFSIEELFLYCFQSTINKSELIEYLFHKFPELVCHCHKWYNWQFLVPYYPFRATGPGRKVLLNLYYPLSHIWLRVEPKQNTFSC